MKRTISFLSCILLGVMLLSMSACAGAPREKEYPEHYEQYAALLGETRETALSRLNLTEQELVPGQKGLYAIPVTAQYNGLTFDVSLEFDEVNGRLLGFHYLTVWDTVDDAIRDVSALAGALTRTFGEARDDIDPNRFSHMSQEELTAAFAAKDTQVGSDYWLVEKRDDAATLEYVAIIREQMGSRRAAIADCLNLTLEMKVSTSEDSRSAAAVLRFRLEPEYVTIITQPGD